MRCATIAVPIDEFIRWTGVSCHKTKAEHKLNVEHRILIHEKCEWMSSFRVRGCQRRRNICVIYIFRGQRGEWEAIYVRARLLTKWTMIGSGSQKRFNRQCAIPNYDLLMFLPFSASLLRCYCHRLAAICARSQHRFNDEHTHTHIYTTFLWDI